MVRLAVTFGVYISRDLIVHVVSVAELITLEVFFSFPFHLGLGGHLALAAHFEDNLN